MTKKVTDYDPDFERIAQNMDFRDPNLVDFNLYAREFKSYFKGKLVEGDDDYEMLLKGSAEKYADITDRPIIRQELSGEVRRKNKELKKMGRLERSLEYIGRDAKGRTLLVSREKIKWRGKEVIRFRDKNGRFASPKE